MTLVDRLKRRNLILGVIAALLVALIVFRPAETSAVKKDALPSLFPDLVLDNVRQIQIQRPSPAGVAAGPTQDSDDVVLSKRDADSWVLASSNGYPASTEKVMALLEGLQGARRKVMVTDRVETFEEYAPTEGWIRVLVQGPGGQALASFDLGKSAAWSEPYVRVEEEGKPAIVRAWNLAADKIGLSLDKWADVALWPGLTLPVVEGIDVFQLEEQGTLSFVKQERQVAKAGDGTEEADPTAQPSTETIWMMRAPKEAEAVKTKVENLIRAFTGMRIQKVVALEVGDAGDEHFGFASPAYRVVVKTPAVGAGGKSQTWILQVGKRVPPATEDGTSDAWYVRRGKDSWVFEVGAISIADFQEPAETYLPTPKPADEPDANDEGAKEGGDEGVPPSDQATGDPGSGGRPAGDLPPLPPLEPNDPPKDPNEPSEPDEPK